MHLRVLGVSPVILRSGSCRGLDVDQNAARQPTRSAQQALELFSISFLYEGKPRSVLRSFADLCDLEASLRADLGSALKASLRAGVKELFLAGPSQRRARILGFLAGLCASCPGALGHRRLRSFFELDRLEDGVASVRDGTAAVDAGGEAGACEGIRRARARPASAPALNSADDCANPSDESPGTHCEEGGEGWDGLGRLGCLPQDLLDDIVALLGHRDLCRLAAASRPLRAVADAPHVWRRALAARFGVADVGGMPAACGGSWKRAFAEMLAGPPELFIVHKVQRRDTVAGLALRYRVTPGDIKRANNILSEGTFRQRESVLVPLPPAAMPVLLRPEEAEAPVPRLHYDDAAQRYSLAFAQSQLAVSDVPPPSAEAEAAAEAAAEARRRARLVRTLQRSMGLSEGEASYYLSSQGFDLKNAVGEMRRDDEWERCAQAQARSQGRTASHGQAHVHGLVHAGQPHRLRSAPSSSS
eukprot:tig00000989_g6107.t1